jgi:hypothetical protein
MGLQSKHSDGKWDFWRKASAKGQCSIVSLPTYSLHRETDKHNDGRRQKPMTEAPRHNFSLLCWKTSAYNWSPTIVNLEIRAGYKSTGIDTGGLESTTPLGTCQKIS